MIDLDELMKLRDAATPGPWKTDLGNFDSDGYSMVIRPYIEADGKITFVSNDDTDYGYDEDDAAYIVAASNAVPELVAHIRELEEQRDVLSTWIANTFIDSGFLPEIETGGMNPPTPEDVRDAVIKVISERKGENRAGQKNA